MNATILLGLALAVAAPAPKETPKDAPKLEGDWVVESFEGEEKGPPGTITFRFADGKISIMEGKKEKPEEAGFTADLKKKPATIDISPDRGKEKIVLGIIEITGDTMKLCFGKDGAERPTEFKGDPTKRTVMITLKRVKPEK